VNVANPTLTQKEQAGTTGQDSYGRPGTTYYYNVSVDGVGHYTVADKALATYYTEVTECTVAQDVNKGKTMTNVNVWVNGSEAVEPVAAADIEDGTATTDDYVNIDELHTTTDTVGSQGRTTEIYKQGTQWIIVYVDTLLGVVTDVTTRDYDTAGHVMNPAVLSVQVTGADDADAIIVESSDYTADWDYKVGDLVLLNTCGMEGEVEDQTSVNSADIVAAIPTDESDFQDNDEDGNPFVVDIVGAPTTVTVTVKGLTGPANTKTGIEGTNGTTYPAANVYTVENTVSTKYIELANSMINGSYNLILDANGNIVGLTPATSAIVNVGVVTAAESKKVGTNKYAIEADMILADGSSKTLLFVDYAAGTGADYLGSGDEPDDIGLSDLAWVKFNTVTLDGTTYYYVADAADAIALASFEDDAAASVTTGVADTLGGTVVVDDTTQFLVAQYKYNYQKGAYQLTGWKNYSGFKNLPTLSSEDNAIAYAVLTDGGVQYVCIQRADGVDDDEGYTVMSQATIVVDESYLVLSKAVTYEYYSVYNVVKNGTKTTINVSNSINDEVDAFIVNSGEANDGELAVFTGKTSDGYFTVVDSSEQAGAPDDTTTIAADKDVVYANGVLTIDDSDYLTVADNCKVQIVNSVTNTLYDGTLSNIKQYENTDPSHAFTFELDSNGYICNLYIID
jgi:hypothetical protein